MDNTRTSKKFTQRASHEHLGDLAKGWTCLKRVAHAATAGVVAVVVVGVEATVVVAVVEATVAAENASPSKRRRSPHGHPV